jgi:hypothetical protein
VEVEGAFVDVEVEWVLAEVVEAEVKAVEEPSKLDRLVGNKSLAEEDVAWREVAEVVETEITMLVDGNRGVVELVATVDDTVRLPLVTELVDMLVNSDVLLVVEGEVLVAVNGDVDDRELESVDV